MPKKSTGQDEISRLLDSFDEDNTLEQKMDAFAKSKMKSRVTKRSEVDATQIIEAPKSSVSDTRIVLGKNDKKVESTMSWQSKTLEAPKSSAGGTVVIDDQEIQSLLEVEKGPQLIYKKAKKVDQGNTTSFGETQKKKNNNKKIIAISIVALVGIALVGLLIFGVARMMRDDTETDQITEQQQAYYQEVMNWAEKYSSYSDSEKDRITEYEKKYNKLTAEQKKQIDETLQQQTGRTFDELLVLAKSAVKEDSSNNNTEIAQKKAELKENINELKTELSSQQQELEDAEKILEEATSNFDAADLSIVQLQGKIDEYNKVITEYNSIYDKIQAFGELNEENEDDKDRIREREILESQLSSLQSRYNKSVSGLSSAQTELAEAEAKKEEARVEIDNTNLSISQIQAQIDDINNRINSYQSEYDSLE